MSPADLTIGDDCPSCATGDHGWCSNYHAYTRPPPCQCACEPTLTRQEDT